MNGPSDAGPGLWERLRSAQDRALAAGHDDAAAEQALVARLTAESPAGRPRLILRLGAVAAALVVLYALAAALRLRPVELALAPGDSAPGDSDKPTLVAEGVSELPLRFPDGSTVTFLPGSSGQVQRQGARSAEVQVRGGRLEAHVVHAAGVRWLVRAGPFRVHVTGTRFGVDWSAGAGVLTVTLREGSVVVDGGALGAGVPLRAGQKLRVGLDGVVRTDAADPTGAPTSTVPETTPAPTDAVAAVGAAAGPARGALDWRALAERGAYREALRAAERAGLDEQLQTLDPHGLLALGDVARYAGASETAVRTFERLVSRFPGHRLAADAVFSLGRLSFEAGRAARAASWFARYARRWPDGPLAEQASGRLIESAAGAGDLATARRAARDYLTRAPQGTYAALARSVLDGAGEAEAPAP